MDKRYAAAEIVWLLDALKNPELGPGANRALSLASDLADKRMRACAGCGKAWSGERFGGPVALAVLRVDGQRLLALLCKACSHDAAPDELQITLGRVLAGGLPDDWVAHA